MLPARAHDNGDYQDWSRSFLTHLASAVAHAAILLGGLLIQAGAGV